MIIFCIPYDDKISHYANYVVYFSNPSLHLYTKLHSKVLRKRRRQRDDIYYIEAHRNGKSVCAQGTDKKKPASLNVAVAQRGMIFVPHHFCVKKIVAHDT